MNAFDSAREVEARSLEILTPFIESRSFDGRFVLIEKGRLAQELQRTIGDAVLTAHNGNFYAVEIKAEESNKHGNLFLETWSNLSRYKTGWMFTLDTDLFLYHFIEDDENVEITPKNIRLRKTYLNETDRKRLTRRYC